MPVESLPEILCVDDEPQVLEGLALQLRRRCQVVPATSGAAGLELLSRPGRFAVIVSDMRMPSMNGAAFLREARVRDPHAVRILLTGQAEMAAAILAVNEGQVFRFLTKPCPPAMLVPAIDAALEQHRLLFAEKELLEKTLHGCIRTLTDALALTNPIAFGRADHLKRRVAGLAERLGLDDRWPLEVAAMVSAIGTLTVPADVLDRARSGQPLTEAEQAVMAQVPLAAEQLLGHIPRLESVREILTGSTRPPSPQGREDPARATRERRGQILRVAWALEGLEAQGHPVVHALGILAGRDGQYDAVVLAAAIEVAGTGSARQVIREVAMAEVRPGMVFVENVCLATGTLLVPKGYEVTPAFMGRIGNYRPGAVREPLRVFELA